MNLLYLVVLFEVSPANRLMFSTLGLGLWFSWFNTTVDNAILDDETFKLCGSLKEKVQDKWSAVQHSIKWFGNVFRSA